VNLLSAAVHLFVRNLLAREEGQDLVEYALVVALMSFGAITGMGSIATGINDVFCGLATTMTSSV
jgi:pilus assembly protein Flp/PilA